MNNKIHDQSVVVCVCRESGRIVVQRARRKFEQPRDLHLSSSIRRSTSGEVAFSRARTRMTDFAVANRLNAFVTLTYESQPEPACVDGEIRNLMKRFRRQNPRQPWVVVSEQGSKHKRIHHHLLVPSTVRRRDMVAVWDRGFIRYSNRPTPDDIRSTAFYMAKSFDLPADQRLSYRRYRISGHGIRPQLQRFEIPEAELDEHIATITNEMPLKKWFATDAQPWFEWVGYWDPETYKNP